MSKFMHDLKLRFAHWFNREHERDGTLWAERFKSVLVESGHAARIVGAYIDLNPVRAGLVADPADYRWSGYAQAVAGKEEARGGLRRVMIEWERMRMNTEMAAQETAGWRKVIGSYRVILFRDGQERPPAAGVPKRRRGIAREKVEEVLGRKGRMSEGELLRRRVRYFTDGLVIGSASFVDRAWWLTKGYFGEARKSGARRLRGVDSPLRSLRDLHADVYG